MLRLSLICFCLAITQSIAYKCKKDGTFRDPEDPRKYYVCTNGEAFPFLCPEDLVFDESTKKCDLASHVKTILPQTNPTTSAPISTHTTQASTHKPEVSTQGSTPKQEVSTQGSTHKQEVSSKGPEVTTHKQEVTTHGSSLDCKGKTGFFKDSTNPHIFHECVNGKDEVFHCPGDLVFNGKECDFDAKEVTKPSEHGSTNKPSADCTGKSGTFSKDPTDPHKFHECVNGKDAVFTCPEHLVFNEAKGECDFNTNPGTGTPVVQTQSTPNSHNTPTPGSTGPPQSEGTRQRHTVTNSY